MSTKFYAAQADYIAKLNEMDDAVAAAVAGAATNTDLDALEAIVTANGATLSTLSGTVTTQGTSISTAQSDITTLTGTVTTNGTALSTAQANIVTIGTSVTHSTISATPNATIPAVKIAPSGGGTNYDIALSPKGTGALLAHVPDNTATGGNKRGALAVDFQMNRGSANEVASGDESFLGSGYANKAQASRCAIVSGQSSTITVNGSNSFIGGGHLNAISATYSVIAGGYLGTISESYGVIGGGVGSTISASGGTVAGGAYGTVTGVYAAIGGGYSNVASGAYSAIPGGLYATTRGIHGMLAYASGRFATTGDAQAGKYVLRVATTDATPSVLRANNSAAAVTNTVALPNNSTYKFTGEVSARNTTNGNSAGFSFSGLIKRGANAAATALVAAVTPTSILDAGAASWTVTVTADTTLGVLKVEVTGVAATNIQWVCVINTVETTY